MFVLVTIEDKIKVNPDLFDQDLNEVLLQQIEIKFSNKILINVGLCVCFYDFIEVDDPYIYPAEGSAHQRVKFRFVVFRPFVGEVLVGRVVSCQEDGIKVSLDFFDDIFIPSYLLQAPSEFKPKLKQWIWKFGEDEQNQVDFILQQGDKIRFRIRTITFAALTSTVKGTTATVTTESQGTLPNPVEILSAGTSNSTNNSLIPTLSAPSSTTISTTTQQDDDNIPIPQSIRKRSTSFDLGKNVEPPAAMQITGSINEDGLGLIGWWE